MYTRIFIHDDDKHKKSLKNKWFLCIFIVDFYDLSGKKAKLKSIFVPSRRFPRFALGRSSKICFSSRRIINFYYACQFVLFAFYYFFSLRCFAEATFFDLFDVHLLVVEMIKHKNGININIRTCITNNNL